MSRLTVACAVVAVAYAPIHVYAGHGAGPAIVVLALGSPMELPFVVVPGWIGLAATVLSALRGGRGALVGPVLLSVSLAGLVELSELRLRTLATALPFLAATAWLVAESRRPAS